MPRSVCSRCLNAGFIAPVTVAIRDDFGRETGRTMTIGSGRWCTCSAGRNGKRSSDARLKSLLARIQDDAAKMKARLQRIHSLIGAIPTMTAVCPGCRGEAALRWDHRSVVSVCCDRVCAVCDREGDLHFVNASMAVQSAFTDHSWRPRFNQMADNQTTTEAAR